MITVEMCAHPRLRWHVTGDPSERLGRPVAVVCNHPVVGGRKRTVLIKVRGVAASGGKFTV